jgi:HORMA domain
LGLNLFYTDDCPPAYEPHGFEGCTDELLSFPSGDGFARKTKKTAGLVSGSHRIGVVVSHVDSAENVAQMRRIPETMKYTHECSRLEEYQALAAQTTADIGEPSSSQLPLSSQPLHASPVAPSPAAPSTQTREDLKIAEALRQMQRSSSRPKDLVPTQTLADTHDLDAGDETSPDQSYPNAIVKTTQTADRRQHKIVSAKMAELLVHVKGLQAQCALGYQVFEQSDLDEGKIKRKTQSPTMKCECRDDSELGACVRQTPLRISRLIADPNSCSARSVALGNTSLAMGGAASMSNIRLPTTSVIAVCFYLKRKTSTTGCQLWSPVVTPSITSTETISLPGDIKELTLRRRCVCG